jgi:hypothetical protein
MLRTLLFAVGFAALITTAAAQDLPQEQQPPKPTPRVQTPAPSPTPTPRGVVPPENARNVRGRDLNVQVELTISDQLGSAAPEKKVVSLLAADQSMGRVRATASARRSDLGQVGTGLNVDARPVILDNDRIMLELTLEYMPLREPPTEGSGPRLIQQPTNLHESLTVILQNGKPLMISQAADPISDRKMTVEVKATVIR